MLYVEAERRNTQQCSTHAAKSGAIGSGVASMEQMEQLLPRAAHGTTRVIHANLMRYSGGEGGGGG